MKFFKLKILFLLLLMLPLISFAGVARFELSVDGLSGIIEINDNGSVSLGKNNFSESFASTIKNELGGINFIEASTKEAQERIIERLRDNIGISPFIRYDSAYSLKNPYNRQMRQEESEFLAGMRVSIRRPVFNSNFLNKKIDFNTRDKDDLEAFKLYRGAYNLRQEQFAPNQNYHRGVFSRNILELRQSVRDTTAKEDLNIFTRLAKGIIDNNSEIVLEAMNWLLNSHEFQKGFGTSIANNFNPASFVYPLEAHCENEWCKTGELLGDATSIFLGSLEFMKGVVTTLGSGGATIALAGAIPATGGVAIGAIPGTIGTTLAGIAMAGHGLNVVSNAISNLYHHLETSENLNKLEKSNEFTKETGFTVGKKNELAKNSNKEVIDEFYKLLRGSKEKKKSLVESFKLETIEMEILKEDRIVYRWHNKNKTAPQKSVFVSPQKITDSTKARQLLALPETNEMVYFDSYILKKGTKVFKGEVAPLNGQPGGGQQYFIITDNILNVLEVIKK